jgi:hypothetical protein
MKKILFNSHSGGTAWLRNITSFTIEPKHCNLKCFSLSPNVKEFYCCMFKPWAHLLHDECLSQMTLTVLDGLKIMWRILWNFGAIP